VVVPVGYNNPSGEGKLYFLRARDGVKVKEILTGFGSTGSPAGLAHGFQTRSDDAVVEYLMGVEYIPDLYDGFRHDDPLVSIVWPEPIAALSGKDASWPPLADRLPWLSERSA